MPEASSYGAEAAAAYEQCRTPYDDVIEFFLKHISSENFLDAGCGTGNDLDAIRKRTGLEGVGCDRSSDMLQFARQRDLSRLCVADLDQGLPFAHQFEAIVAHDVLHHLKEPLTFLRSARQCLKSGRPLLIGTETHDDLRAKFTSRYFPTALEADLARYPSLEITLSRLRRAGFNDVTIYQQISTVSMTEEIMEQVRNRAHSVLHCICDEDFATGFKNLKAAYKVNQLQAMPWHYTLISAASTPLTPAQLRRSL